MDQKTHDKGLEIRKAVLGEAYVDNALKNADSFNKPFQELVTEYCWGAVWGRDELPRKTRSMLNLAMIAILNRPHELKAHIKGALTNGVTKNEIREILMQVAIYGGMPAAVDKVSGWIRQIATYERHPQKYHHTVSRAWVEMIAHHVDADPGCVEFDRFAERHPALLDKRLLARHYRSATLAPPQARRGWVEPDGLPFPWS